MADSRVKRMIASAPDGARPCYRFITDQYGSRDIVAVAADWDASDSPVLVYIQTGQAARASRAADAAEEEAARAKGHHAAVIAAYRLAWDAADADAVTRVLRAACASRAACEEAVQAAEDAHRAARETHRYARDDDRAAATADDAHAAAERAGEAAQEALAGRKEAEAAVRAAGVDPDALAAACDQAAALERYRAERDFRERRQERAPQWRPMGYGAGRFGGDPRRALEALAAEYMGVRT